MWKRHVDNIRQEPVIRPIQVFDSSSWPDILPEIPLWVKNSDYERVDWLNMVINDMWPYLNKALCNIIKSTAEPIYAEYIGKFQIQSIDLDTLTLGTIPPAIHGLKVYDSNEKHLVLEPAVRFAGNSNIILVLKVFYLNIHVQLIDLQVSVAPRLILKPLVPAFPCFASIIVSLMEKPQIDFGLKLMGCDLMAIPGLHHLVQETIKRQVASLFLWPQTFEIPILDTSLGAAKKPVGLLHVKVLRAEKLLKMDLLSASDPYVKLSLSGERLPAKKTSIKMNNLNPEWNEDFKLTVKDPQTQVLQIHVYDWEKVGRHDKLGMQLIPLKLLVPHERKEFAMNLLKNINPNDTHDRKQRGKIMLDLTFVPFKEDYDRSGSLILQHSMKNSSMKRSESESSQAYGAGLLFITIVGAKDVEGKHHTNPSALVVFRGEMKKTKTIKKTRDPTWEEEFQFMLDEAPLKDVIHIEIISTKRFGFRLKESLGLVRINLVDVVHNGRINEKFNLINSRNGVIHLDMRWTAA
ncbi:synaptotagmin-3-like isoform X2 [Daucus carota subsp. sativus]|uniref:synaptotagmin-3-like isoform X2 n=1 Tax=Daucus carota subsp. sativus TaxID=79200 RepID=UPI0007EFE7E4|nr:PREDICTED: synaptotagmin-3-like isoform X2 [Daucus carota subsp. sativus]